MIDNLIIGAIGSLIASVIFLALLYRLRPKLGLCSKIAKVEHSTGKVYALKVVNLGRRDATSIKAELLLLDPELVEGGYVNSIFEVPLVKEEVFVLSPIKDVKKDFGKTYEFITTLDLELEWKKYPKAKLIFRVRAQDSFSGFAKVFSKDFCTRNDIIAGRFGEGDSMNINPNPSLQQTAASGVR